MIRKNFFLILSAFISVSGFAGAQEVTVTGMGTDRDSAVRDASRLAVEQVVGTFIDSRTLMQDLVIQLDDVFKKSQGFVKSIKILSEGSAGDSTYKVTARIDVDTNPNSALADKMTMLLRLNDPRIAVVVLDGDMHNDILESALNDKLIESGFTRVADSDQVIKLYDAQLLNSVTSGQTGSFDGEKDNAVDYLVKCKLQKDSANVILPRYGESGMLETSMINAKINLKADIIKYDTGEIVGTFTVDGTGLENSLSRAEDKAARVIADKAAEKLVNTFKKFSARSSNGLTFTITADNPENLEKVVGEIRNLGAVDNLQIREQSENKMILSIETSFKPHEIVTLLKNRSRLGIFTEKMSNSACSLRIT